MPTDLYWLPKPADGWREDIEASALCPDQNSLSHLLAIANTNLRHLEIGLVDRAAQKFSANVLADSGLASVKLAILGTSTLGHLIPSIRLAGLRKRMAITCYTNEFGQYKNDIILKSSNLYQFDADCVLFTQATPHIFASGSSVQSAKSICDELVGNWQTVRNCFSGSLIQQTFLPIAPALLGHNEHRYPASCASVIWEVNQMLRERADAHGVDILSIDPLATQHGVSTWFNPGLWHRGKQDIHPLVAPIYGDAVGRLLAAQRGLSKKCLVLDLDNTLWGGVIGDDGIQGIILGQGSPVGEAFLDFQKYAQSLSDRGIILAICSKNDEKNVLEALEHHPEMLLRKAAFSCIKANWQDKPAISGKSQMN